MKNSNPLFLLMHECLGQFSLLSGHIIIDTMSNHFSLCSKTSCWHLTIRQTM